MYAFFDVHSEGGMLESINCLIVTSIISSLGLFEISDVFPLGA
jgi:hypothetical protein